MCGTDAHIHEGEFLSKNFPVRVIFLSPDLVAFLHVHPTLWNVASYLTGHTAHPRA